MRKKSSLRQQEMGFQFESPHGTIYGRFSARGLCSLTLPKRTGPRKPVACSSVDDPRTKALKAALNRYFSGLRETFSDIPLDLTEGTPFQQLVWKTARETRWGATSSYGGLAERMGRKNAARAVGQALGANPIAIVVPCHRFLTADGSLGGFSGGLNWKRTLLGIEGIPAD